MSGNKVSYYIAAVVTVMAVFVFFSYKKIDTIDSKQEAIATDARKFAGTLISQKLYREAAIYLEKHIEQNPIVASERESTIMFLADLYLQNLSDAEKAMACYLKLLHEFPATKYFDEANRKVIECKTILGRRFEAMNDLNSINEKIDEQNRTPALKGQAGTAENSVIVAKIGDEKMTMSDFAREVDAIFEKGLPKDIEKKENKLKILKEILARKVLKKVAATKRFDVDGDIVKKTENIKTQLMLEKLLNSEVISKVTVDDMSLRLYYDAHKNEMKTPDLYKFSYITTGNSTDAVDICQNTNLKKFVDASPKQTKMASLEEISSEIGADLSQYTSEISLAKTGEFIKKPVNANGGLIVLKMADQKKGEPLAFEAVKEGIRRELLARKREEATQEYVIKCFADLNVITFDEVFKETQISTSEVSTGK